VRIARHPLPSFALGGLLLVATVAAAADGTPRIAPLPLTETTPEIQALEQRRPDRAKLNIIRTMARHPDLHKAWGTFTSHILGNSTLPDRDRELLTLRIGWLCRAEYEWSQHRVMAREAGVTAQEIDAVMAGPSSPVWNDFDRTLLVAVDELHADARIGDATWRRLRERYDDRQMMDLVFTVGQYNMIAMALNSFGVQVDPGYEGFPPDGR
jgi:alkylhydroperoxidase family enzyme